MLATFTIDPTVSVGDLAQAAAVVVASLAVLAELRRAHRDRDRQQRIESAEHRWRQANAARELLTDIHDHPHAAAAIRMLDWGEKWQNYRLPSGLPASINLALAKIALDDAMSEDESYLYVRECFDWLLYYLDRLGQPCRSAYRSAPARRAQSKGSHGWQAASSNFQDIVGSFAICTSVSR